MPVAESIQLALYLHAPTRSASKLWEEGWGGEPQGTNRPAVGHTQAFGTLNGNQATVISQPDRIDILLSGVLTGSPPSEPAHLTDLTSAIADAMRLVHANVASLKVARTACVMLAYELTDNVAESVAALKKMVPHLPFPDGSEDIIFQYVTESASKVDPGRQLKCLRKWQTVLMQLMSIQIQAGGVPLMPVPQQQKFAVQMMADVFAPNPETLQSEAVMASLEEVISIAKSSIFDAAPNAD